MKKLYWGLAVLVLLSPLGLLAQGTAWGEWSAHEFGEMVGYVPGGMKALESFWRAPLADYAGPGWENGPGAAVGYIFSGLVGVGLIFLVFKMLDRFLVDSGSNSIDHEDS